MDVNAAVAHRAGESLTSERVRLDGPKAGEVVELKATDICHTDGYMDGNIEIAPLITHTLPLDRIIDGFDLMHAGQSIRSVVLY